MSLSAAFSAALSAPRRLLRAAMSSTPPDFQPLNPTGGPR